jgi:Tfp pilus assembly protein PilF
MSRPNALALLPLAESIADGAPIDWDAAEAGASDHDLAMIRQLRVLSNLAGLHRSLPSAASEAPGAAPARQAIAAPAIGSWAHLALIERLGGGTFGDVYRAWDRHLEREVALKLLRADESIDDLHASRIAMEGRLLARVRHPNVISVHGVDVHDRRVGLWMELVRGATLEQRLLEDGPFSAREASLVGIDLCRALAAIHAAGLIHRDVKAQNVMREDGGRIVLMDLGTGREAGAGGGHVSPDLAGTPLYLAPEIFSGAAASERTDLYSLGVLLYHLVTGSFPVRATTVQELHNGHKQGLSLRLRDARADLPTAFVRVVDRAIASDPQQRYATAGALEADLVQALEDQGPGKDSGRAAEPVTVRPATSRSPRGSTVRKTAFAAVLLVAAIAGAALWSHRRISNAVRPAAVAGPKVRIAVLPPRNLTGRTGIAEWPQLIQALFVDELTGVHDVAIIDPLSMNAMVASAFGADAPQRAPQLFDLLRRSNATMAIDGTIVLAGGVYQLQINLVDTVTGETRFPARVTVASEEKLVDAVRSLADGVLGFLQLQVLQLANDKDLRPWISYRRQNIQAVNAFLQASQHIYRYERVAGEKYLRRAIELDPTFIVPRVWLIPGLVDQNKPAEAQASYEYLLQHAAGASPFEEAMIAFAGATLTHDLAAEARQLEIALDYLPGNNILLMNLAEVRELRGDCAGALDAMRPAVAMRWQYPPMYPLWGFCSIQTGRPDDARQVMLTALTFPIVHPNLYGLLEALAIADGDATQAGRYRARYVARLREIDRPADVKDLVQAYASLGSSCLAKGQYDRAAALFAKAVAAEPRVPQHYDDLADVFQKMGRVAAAEEQYSRALTIDPKWPHALLMLARINDARNDTANAVRFYRAYLALAQGPEADAVKLRLRELESARR